MTNVEVNNFLNDIGAAPLGPNIITLHPLNDTLFVHGNGRVELQVQGGVQFIGNLFDNSSTYGNPINRVLRVGGYQFTF